MVMVLRMMCMQGLAHKKRLPPREGGCSRIVYLYVYVWICMYVYMYMYVCKYVCKCICMYMHIYVCICMNTHVCVYVYVCMYVSMYVNVFVCFCMYMHVYVWIRMYMYVCVYIYIYLCIDIYGCLYMYMYGIWVSRPQESIEVCTESIESTYIIYIPRHPIVLEKSTPPWFRTSFHENAWNMANRSNFVKIVTFVLFFWNVLLFRGTKHKRSEK